MHPVPVRWDAAIARIAASQHGVISRTQLEHVGLGRGAITHRIAAGRLHPVQRGIYLVGHPAPGPLALETAALLACGTGSVLSHFTAARVLKILPAADDDIDVTVTLGRSGRRPGIRAHRRPPLAAPDVTRRHGLPLTAPALTVLELAAVSPMRTLERAVAEVLAQRLVRRRQLTDVLARCPGRPGTRPLRSLLAAEIEPALTRSDAEERLLALVRAAALPPAEANARVGRHEVDVLWRSARLAVEVDGYAFHSSRTSFERDRLRDAELQAAGLRVMRVTWRQIVDEPMALVGRLAQALAAAPLRPA